MCKRVLKHQTSQSGEIPFYKISTFGGKANAFIAQDLYDEFREKYSFPKKGDILISAAGTVGETVIYDGKPAYFQDSNIVWIDNDETKILNSYLYYFYQTKPWLTTNGSTIKRIYNDNLRSIDITYPESLNDQQNIAAVLSALDAKIELNQRINAELESMAKTLYDYWFVQFDFPNEQGKPYKSAGGKMVWNEELKREIPLGWEVKELGNILSLEYGKPLKEEERSGSGYPVVGSNGIVGYHKDYFVEGYGIVVGRKGTAGAVVWVEDNFYPIDTTFYIQDKLGVKELFFHYQLLRRSNFKQLESSSAVPGLNRNFAYSIKYAIPEVSLIQEFNKIAEPIFSKIKACNKESQTLTELRDWLLPMLMNGQVVVK